MSADDLDLHVRYMFYDLFLAWDSTVNLNISYNQGCGYGSFWIRKFWSVFRIHDILVTFGCWIRIRKHFQIGPLFWTQKHAFYTDYFSSSLFNNNKIYLIYLNYLLRMRPRCIMFRLKVENLSSRVSWQDLKDLLRRGGDVTFAEAHTVSTLL